ncbi:MAG TPA: hypothetical protein VIC87_00050, partial [Vicinamibacteria bacterium]
QRSGSYIVEDLGPGSTTAMKTDHPAPVVSIHSGPPPASPPTATVTPMPTPVTAEASTESATEAQNGRPRRRRGRGRGRGSRGASPLAAGAYVDPHAPPPAEDDEDDDDATEESAHAEDREPEPAPPPPAAASERAPFSIFSWLRRDAPAEGSAPAPPAGERKPEE